MQEHRAIYDDIIIEEPYVNWKLITCSIWTNSANAATGGIGLLVNSRTLHFSL